MPVAADIYYHIYQDTEGEKIPVVLIHGAGGTHLYWPAQIRRLAGSRVYALDLPGHGKSGGRGRQTVAGYAQAILAWMEAVPLHRAVFIGHSMGSAIALLLALDHAEHVMALGLLGSAPRMQVSPQILERAAFPDSFGEAIELVTTWSYAGSTSPQLVGLAAKRMAETRPAVLHGDFLACDNFDVTGRLSEIGQPTLVVCGAQDRMTPLRHSQLLASAIPQARLEVIPDAGHMVMIEQPEAVASALSRFLKGITF